jgi:hypothetical protein
MLIARDMNGYRPAIWAHPLRGFFWRSFKCFSIPSIVLLPRPAIFDAIELNLNLCVVIDAAASDEAMTERDSVRG